MKSILMIGLGRFGRHMAQKFIEQGNAVLAIEKNEEIADNSIDIIQDIQIGDAKNEMFIESLGVSNFDLCVVAIGDDFLSSRNHCITQRLRRKIYYRQSNPRCLSQTAIAKRR